jgi:hypothetical protein
MNPALPIVKEKVQKILTTKFSHVELTQDGFSLRHESARAFVRVWAHDDDSPIIIGVDCPVLFNVKPTPELFRYIALHGNDYIFGHLSADETDDGIMIMFTHSLLGDYLDEDELGRAVAGVLGTGNDIDDELKAKFGGNLFHED